jgi:hypothetical protein
MKATALVAKHIKILERADQVAPLEQKQKEPEK